MVNLKQRIAITPFAIGDQRDNLGLFDELAQALDSSKKKLSVFGPTSHLPDKTAGPVHEHNRPALGVFWRHILGHFRIGLIAFDDLVQEDMGQGVHQQDFVQVGKALFPVQNRLLANVQRAAHRIQSKTFGTHRDDVDDSADRCPQSLENRRLGFREHSAAISALV